MFKYKVKEVERIFYPVGQGAFYQERFVLDNNEVFNIVYDCGTKTQQGNEKIKEIIDGWQDERIDILFISHFHEDHISGIPYLIEKKKPKMVIMPYLTDDDKYYYQIGLLYSNLVNSVNDNDIKK